MISILFLEFSEFSFMSMGYFYKKSLSVEKRVGKKGWKAGSSKAFQVHLPGGFWDGHSK